MDVLYMIKFVLKIKNPVEGEKIFKKKKKKYFFQQSKMNCFPLCHITDRLATQINNQVRAYGPVSQNRHNTFVEIS